MNNTQLKAEMPYQCTICGYRTSFHRDLVDHFQEVHDRTDKLQCTHCLKTLSLCSDKGYNSTVASLFVQHLQIHVDKNVACKKCCLTFHTPQLLSVHVEKDHVSYKTFEGKYLYYTYAYVTGTSVIRIPINSISYRNNFIPYTLLKLDVEYYQCKEGEDSIKMPQPDERNIKTAPRKPVINKATQQQSAFAAQNLEDMVMYDVDREDCGECSRKINLMGHYT